MNTPVSGSRIITTRVPVRIVTTPSDTHLRTRRSHSRQELIEPFTSKPT